MCWKGHAGFELSECSNFEKQCRNVLGAIEDEWSAELELGEDRLEKLPPDFADKEIETIIAETPRNVNDEFRIWYSSVRSSKLEQLFLML